jgi:4-aminobutyrate--pyruvate transaminase
MHARDIAYHIHSQTNLALHETVGPTIMVRGDGVFVYDDAGNKYLEAMAGLWSAALGFSEKRLAEAAMRQFEKLPYYQNFAHRATEPAIELAEKLIQRAPVPMSKVVFQSSGSEANDTAIKLVWYYWHGLDKPAKNKIISRQRAYHGTTVASGSLTGLPHIHRDFRIPLPGFIHVTCPHHYRNALPGETEEAFSIRLADELEQVILREGPETVAAFFAEPVMGTGGVLTPPAGYFDKIQKVLRRHDVLLVVDEVITGFGRTGNWWGSQTYDIVPDLLTTAKALSASYLPISAVLVNERVYQVMRSQSEKIGTFGHGYTYGGHPIAASVALEAIRIYEERDIVVHAREVGARLQKRLRQLEQHPLVGEVRGVGLIAGVEVVRDKETREAFDPKLKVGAEVSRRAQEHGLVVRALGDSLVFTPPLIITEPQIDMIADRFAKALDDTLPWLQTEGVKLGKLA